MKLSSIIEKLNLEIINDSEMNTKEVEGVYIGDLLSVVMARAKPNFLWLTIQTHINIIAVATLVDLAGIIIIEGMEIDKETIEKAKEVGMPLFKTNLSAYDMACRLKEIGL